MRFDKEWANKKCGVKMEGFLAFAEVYGFLPQLIPF